MRKVIITEEQFNKNRKHLIREYFEVLKGRNANKVLKLINNMYQIFVTGAEQGETEMEEKTKIFGIPLTLTVSNSKFDDNSTQQRYGFYDPHKHILQVTCNTKALENYAAFREVILHELTHALDYKRENGIHKKKVASFDQANKNRMVRRALLGFTRMMFDSTEDENERIVGAILYRLWVPTERNAYTTKALNGEEEFNTYIATLKERIGQVRDADWSDPKYTMLWNKLKKIMGLPENTTIGRAVNVFCKKSLYLLDKFVKKANQRMKQHSKRKQNKYDTASMDVMNKMKANIINK